MKRLKFIRLILLICLGSGIILAQTDTKTPASSNDGENRCANFNQPDFQGDPVNIEVVNADLKDILNQITGQFGCHFVVDKSVKIKPVTVKADNFPWNLALNAILQLQDLGYEIKGPVIRIAKAKVSGSELGCGKLTAGANPLYTEFIKLNYLPLCEFCPNGYTLYAKRPEAVPSKLVSLVKKQLTKRGAVEIDYRSNTLIITDLKEKIEFIRKQLEEWDKPNQNADKIIRDFDSKNK